MTSLRPIEDLINHDIKLLFIVSVLLPYICGDKPLAFQFETRLGAPPCALRSTKITQLGISRTNISEKKA